MKICIYFLVLVVFIIQDTFACGSKPSRIINGETASVWPWIVSLQFTSQNTHFCGGSLIGSQYVLTAAHCLSSLPSFKIVAGTNDLNEANLTTYQVSSVTLHPDYSSDSFDNDIALVKLTQNIIESSKISTICLPDSADENIVINEQLYIAGWGFITPNGPISDILLETILQIYDDRSICPISSNLHYCAFDPTGKNSNTCSGDSGGPLMYLSNGRWYVFGLTSFGFANQSVNCLNTLPSYYTRIPKYIDWINANMNNGALKLKYSNFFIFLTSLILLIIF